MIRIQSRVRALGAPLLLLLAFAPVARAQGGDLPQLRPVSQRLSDDVIAADQATLDQWQQRLLAARNAQPALPQYPFEKAQRWLSLARETYEMNSPDATASDALGEAVKLIRELEAGRTPALTAGTLTPVYAPRVRPDMWKVADMLRASPDVERVAPELATLELSLVRAALEAARYLGCPLDKPQRVAEAAAMRAVGIINRPPPGVVQVAPSRVDTLYIARPLPMPAPAEPPKATTPKVLTGVPPNVHFGLNLDSLSAASKRVLATAADSLLRYAGVNITLSGNTDSRGNVAYNQALSKRRAEAVKAFLVGKGIEAERIQIQALGKANLKTSEKDVVDLARNRRVDITYVAIDGRVIETKEGLDDLQVEGPRVQRTPQRPRGAKPKP
jgi:outer membrane protein OmpA-like peptidoglycan-associated protein